MFVGHVNMAGIVYGVRYAGGERHAMYAAPSAKERL